MRRIHLSLFFFWLFTPDAFASYFDWRIEFSKDVKIDESEYIFDTVAGFKCEVSRVNHFADKNNGRSTIKEGRTIRCKNKVNEFSYYVFCSSPKNYADQPEFQIHLKEVTSPKNQADIRLYCLEK